MKIRKEIRIGIIGIIALIMLFFGLNFLKGINMFKPVNHFYVAFDDVAGIALSSPVFANGYQIGTVRNISFDYKRMDRVIVEVKTEKKMNIPKGSYAELVTEMLGTVKMNVLLKANNTKEFYAPGDTIQGKANKGLTALASDELLPRLKMTMDKVDSLLNNLNTILSDPALSSTLKNTQQMTANLDVTTRKLNIMMEKDIPNITNRLSTITDNFTTISDNLKGIDYAQTLQKVDSTITNVQLLTAKLTQKDNSLGKLLNDDEIYKNLNETSANAAALLKDLKAHPKRYVHFSIFGKKDKTEELPK